MKGEYLSVGSGKSATLKVEGSKFIAEVFPVADSAAAEERIAEVRKKYHDATHHCFAYAIGGSREEFRYSDAGEPAGTAGIRILSAIESKDLSDLCVVVTRYFGGTKLGVGGLGRAYFEAALSVLSAAPRVTKILADDVRITFPYEETNPVMTILARNRVRIADTVYGDDVTLHLMIRSGATEAILGQLREATKGNMAGKIVSEKNRIVNTP
ncbi:MAG TPA: YigZ family protein [Bacteroidota bacterium]|nr:YigZ family protein [Bacteroidota bacterium]